MLARQLSIIPRTFLRYVTEMMHRSSHPAICLQRRAMGYGTMGLPAGDSIWSGASVPRSLALVFLTRLFRSRLWIMLLRHLQRRQLMAPPSFYRRRRLGSLPIQPPRPSTSNFNRCDMGAYDGEAYNSISSLKPGKEKNVISRYALPASYHCFCNCILNSRSQIIRKYTSFCFWVILCHSMYDCTNLKGPDFYSPEPSSQDFKLRRVCDREPREEIGPTRTCRVKKK